MQGSPVGQTESWASSSFRVRTRSRARLRRSASRIYSNSVLLPSTPEPERQSQEKQGMTWPRWDESGPGSGIPGPHARSPEGAERRAGGTRETGVVFKEELMLNRINSSGTPSLVTKVTTTDCRRSRRCGRTPEAACN